MTAVLDDVAVAPLSRKQRRFLARSNKRVNLCDGSVRSGKTYITLVRWLTFISDDCPTRGALVIVGKSRDTVYRNIFEPIENDPTLAVFKPYVSYKLGAPTATIFGRVVHVMGANDARAESKVRGMTLAGALVDELTTLSREFFKQLLARASVEGAMIFATTNPDAPKHWLKSEYIDRAGELPDWGFWHFTMEDNPTLSESYKRSLKREYAGLWYLRFIDGKWVAAEGAIYDVFDTERHVVKRADLPVIERVLSVGVDYGTTHATRGYLVGMGRSLLDSSKYALYVLDEFAPAKATVGQHAQMFRAWLADQPSESFKTPEWIAIDPAAAVFRQQLFDDGDTNLMRAHNAVLPGIQTISSLLAASSLFIVDECMHLLDGITGYRWDSAASAKGLTKPIKEDDDEVDALRYAIYSVRRLWRADIQIAAAENTQNHERDDNIDSEG